MRGWPLGASVRVTAAAGDGDGDDDGEGEAADVDIGEALPATGEESIVVALVQSSVARPRRLRVEPAGDGAGVPGSEAEAEDEVDAAEASEEDDCGERSDEPAAAATPRSSDASLEARVCGCCCC